MDLNKSPPDFDYDFLGESDANPLYCTQAEDGGCVGAVHDIEHIPEQDPSVFPVGNYLATVGNNVDEAAQNVQVNDENTKICKLWKRSGQHLQCHTLGKHFPLNKRRGSSTTLMQNELGSQFVQGLHASQV